MFGVSAAYREAMKQPAIRTRVSGTVGGIPFGDDNILTGSLTLTNQNSGTENVQIGTVFIGELSVTLRGLGLDRYTLRGMEIALYFELLLLDGVSWESVPVGRFYIGEANHTAAGVVIKAYDTVSKLDKRCTRAQVVGTPYQLAKLACDACFVTLATDQATFSGFANGAEMLTLWEEGTDIETWRDFLSWVAQSCACYVTANRLGQIELRPYTQTVVDTVDPAGRFSGASYSDYETRYTGLYCTDIEDGTMTYYGLAQDDGLTYSLGQNPFLQYGTDEGREVLRRAVLNKLALICYVPFSATLPENPAYDLGDVLCFPGGLGDAEKLFCITKYTWTYHKGIALEGVGENPAMASAQSKTDKNIAGLLSKLSDDAMHYYDYLNAAEIVIHDGETADIINLRYATTKDTHVDFHAEIRALIDTLEEEENGDYTEHDITGTVTYYLNEEIVAYFPVFTEFDGVQLRHLLYFYQTSAKIVGTFRATLTAAGGDIVIPAGHLHAYWAGEGLVGEVPDTNPNVSDTLRPITFELFAGYSDTAAAELQTPQAAAPAETVPALYFRLLAAPEDAAATLRGVSFTPYLSTDYVTRLTALISGSYWIADQDGQLLQTANIYGVAGFVSPDGGALSYQCSFDNGASWSGWNGAAWEPDLEMTYATISALTGAEFGAGAVMFRIIFDRAEKISGFTAIGGRINE